MWPTHLNEHGVNSAIASHAGRVAVQGGLNCDPPCGAVDLKVLVVSCNNNNNSNNKEDFKSAHLLHKMGAQGALQ